MNLAENTDSYTAMLPALKQAQFGSYLILPFQFEEGGFHDIWADQTLTARDVTTVDLTEIARSMLNREGHLGIGRCWMIFKDILLQEMTGGSPAAEQPLLYVETDAGRRRFSLADSWLYVFHSCVAFLALGILYDEIETLADIVNLGGVRSRAAFCYEDKTGRHPFSMESWIGNLASSAGLSSFFSSRSNPFLDVFTETLAVIPQRFRTIDAMRQATFNLHLSIPFGNPISDNSEEDVRFVYAKISETSHTYRWATCITSQTEAYIVADPEMDLNKHMEIRGRAGLPVVMLALYEKYTCLHYTQVLAKTDVQHLRPIQKLKIEMLEFQAYGTLAPANISRWHNIRLIYGTLLELNDIPGAIADVNHKISILSEHQHELESQRSELLAKLITAFGIVSILASVLTIIQILLGGNVTLWASLILTVVFISLTFLLAIFRRKR